MRAQEKSSVERMLTINALSKEQYFGHFFERRGLTRKALAFPILGFSQHSWTFLANAS